MPVGKTAGQLGVWLRHELTRRGYNLAKGGQSRFAREAGIAPSIVNRVLNEDRGAEIDVLRRMGGALGYTLGEMLIHAGLAEHSELPARSPEDLAASSENPYTDIYQRQIWDMRGLSEFVRRSLIIALDSAIRHEREQDGRPDAEVRQFRRPS